MPSNIISADYKVLQQIASRFEQEQQNVQKILRDVENVTDALRHGGWVSDAATQFYRNMDQAVFPRLNRLSKALQNSARATRHIEQVMHTAEEEASGQLNGLDKSSAGGSLLVNGASGGLLNNLLPNGQVAGGFAAWEGSASTGWGSASAKALGWDASAGYETSIGLSGAKVSGTAQASAFLAKGELSAKAAGFAASADGIIGAEASASGEAAFNPLTGNIGVGLRGDAFAGARVTGSASADLGIANVGGTVGAQAGIGIGGHLDAGLKDGKLSLDLGGQFALGVGLEGDVKVSIPILDISHTIAHVGKESAKTGEAALHFAKQLF